MTASPVVESRSVPDRAAISTGHTGDLGSTAGGIGSVLVFFALTFLVTWSCFLTLVRGVPVRSLAGQLLVYAGTIAPSLVALALTALREGRQGVRALLGRLFPGRVNGGFYVFAVTFMAIVKLAAAAIHRLLLGAWPRFDLTPLALFPFVMLISTPVQAGEEVGWRGYALPRLAERMGLGSASLLLGLIWAVWHLPLFFVAEADTYRQSFPVYAIGVMALSVVLAWLYARTRTLLLPMLFHAAVNNSKDIVPAAVPGGTSTFGFGASTMSWLTAGVLWAAAAYFLATMKRTETKPG